MSEVTDLWDEDSARLLARISDLERQLAEAHERIVATEILYDAAEAQLKAVVEAAHPEREADEDERCQECGEWTITPPALDPSPECNLCAQKILAAVRAALASVEKPRQ